MGRIGYIKKTDQDLRVWLSRIQGAISIGIRIILRLPGAILCTGGIATLSLASCTSSVSVQVKKGVPQSSPGADHSPSPDSESVVVEGNWYSGNTPGAESLPSLGPQTSLGGMTRIKGTAALPGGKEIQSIDVALFDSTSARYLGAVITLAPPINLEFQDQDIVWLKAQGTGEWALEVPNDVFTEGHQYVTRIRITDTDRREYSPPPLTPFIWDATPPLVTGIVLSPSAQDYFLSAAEKASSSPLLSSVTGEGFVAIAYALVADHTLCNESQTFAGDIPVASGPFLEHGVTLRICIRALDGAQNATYFASEPITVDTEPPLVTLPPSITGDAASVNISATVTGATSYAWSQVSGPSTLGVLTPSASGTVISAPGNGTYELRMTATDSAGNQASATTVITWNLAPVTFTGVALSGAASDGYLNASERVTSTPILGTVVASGAATIEYAIIQIAQPCQAGLAYSATVPLANSERFAAGDGRYKVCLKLSNHQGVVVYGTSPEIRVVTALPQVEAGPPIETHSSHIRTGTVTGSNGPYSVVWSQIGGPGSLVFGSSTHLTTAIAADTDGTYTVRLTATDVAGNTVSDAFDLTWDTVSPVFTALPLAHAAVDGYINGSEDSASTALVTAPVASGYDSASYKVIPALQSCTTAQGYSVPTPSPQSASLTVDGAYKVCVKLMDDAGHVTYGSSPSFTRDTQGPQVTPMSAVVARSSVEITPVTTGASSFQWTKMNGTGMVTFGSATSASTTISADQDGVYTLRFTALDEAGNSAMVDLSLTWDTTPPVFTSAALGSDVADGYLNLQEKTRTNALILNLQATGYSADTYALTLAGGQCQGPLVYGGTPLSNAPEITAEGVYKVCVRLEDLAGNVTIGSSPSFVFDSTPPGGVSAGSDREAHSSVTLQGTAEDAATFEWRKISGPGALIFGAATAHTTTVSSDTQGAYVIQFTAADAAGNTASSTMNFTWDTTPPVFTSISLSGDVTDGYLNISERGQSSALVGSLVASGFIEVHYAVSPSQNDCSSQGNYEEAIPPSLHGAFSVDGSYKICVKLTDGAGNVTYGASASFAVDLTPPNVDLGGDETSGIPVNRTATVVGASSLLWSKEAGEGDVVFGTPTSATTTISADNAAPYTIALTATDSAGNSTKQTFVLTWVTEGPLFTALPLSGVASDGYINQSEKTSTDPLVGDPVGTDFSTVSYGLTAASASCASLSTYASAIPSVQDLTTDGVYKVCTQLTGEPGLVTYGASDPITLDTVPPVVSAGESLSARTTVSQQAVVTGAATYQWVKVSGPGSLIFGSPSAPLTTMEATGEGVYVVRITATDAAGNSALSDMTLTWDTTPPLFTALPLANDAGNGFINAAERLNTFPLVGSLSASGYDSALYQVALNSTSCDGPLAYGAIPQSHAPAMSADGTYKVCVKLIDAAGNIAYGASPSFEVDTTPPLVVAGPNRTGNTTVTHMTSVTGGSTFMWSKDSGPGMVTFGSPADKDTTITASAEGTYVLRLTATDAAGNTAFGLMSLVWDLTAPLYSSISLAGPASDGFLNGSEVTLTSPVVTNMVATGYDQVLYAVTSQPVCDGTLTYSNAIPKANHSGWGPSDGSYKVCIKLLDAAGNITFGASPSVTVDTTPPTVSAGHAVLTRAQTTLTGSATGASVYEWTQTNGPGVVTLGTPTVLSTTVAADLDGVYTLQLMASDLAGNTATSQVSFTWDTTPPEFTSVALSGAAADNYVNLAEKTASTSLVGTLTATGYESVSYKLVSQSVACSNASDYGQAPLANALSSLGDGAYKICAKLEDGALNVTYGASPPFTLDTALPTVAFASMGTISSAHAAAFTIAGACSEESRTVTLSGAITAVATCTSGSFSVSVDVSSKSDGPLALKADLTDIAGNSANQAVTTVTKDTTAPVVTISNTGYINGANANAYAVTGTCSEDSRSVLIGGSILGEATCNNGSYTVSLSYANLPDGLVTVTARMTDAAGNVSPLVTSTLTKNTTAPTVSITQTGYINAANASLFNVSGACSESGQPVTLGGTRTASATCVSGAFTTPLDFSGAPDGTISITAAHASSVGNSATPASITLTKDTVAPSVELISSGSINTSNVSGFTVTGTCSEEARTVILGGAVSATALCANGAFTKVLDYSSVADGPVVMTADFSDAAGNPATRSTVTLTKDTIPPTVTIVGDLYINGSVASAYVVTGTCSENTRTVTIGGTVSQSTPCNQGAFSISLNVASISDGPITITANHTDAAGNAAAEAVTTVTKDTVPPSVTLTAEASINLSNKTLYTVSGTCSEHGRPVDIGGTGVDTALCQNGVFTGTMDYSSAADGAVSITANHNDAAGNHAAQATTSVTKDTVRPTVTIANSGFINGENAALYAVTGTCSENSQPVTVGGSAGGSTPCAEGAFSLTLDYSSMSNGPITITAQHVDAAGNTSSPTAVTLTKDTLLPSVSITNSGLINNAEAAHYEVTGLCSEDGQSVLIEGAVSGSTTCDQEAFRVSLDFSGLVDGPKTLQARHTDAAGNTTISAPSEVVLDTLPPLVDAGPDTAVNGTFTQAGAVTGSTTYTWSKVSGPGTITFGSPGSLSTSITATTDGTYVVRLTATDVAGNTASDTMSFIWDTVPSKLAITGVSSVTAGTCSGAISVRRQNSVHLDTAASSAVTVSLGGPPDGSFYSNATCATTITSVTIPASSASATVYYSSQTAGAKTLTVSAAGLTSGNATLTVAPGPATQLSISAAPTLVMVNTCSSAITIQSRDALQNSAPLPSSTPLTITGLGSAALYGDAACNTLVSSPSIEGEGGASSVTFYLKDPTPEDLTLSISASGLTSTSARLLVYSGPATALGVKVAANTTVLYCEPVTIEGRDSNGKLAPLSGATSVSLTRTGSTLTYYSTSACSGTALSAVAFAANDASKVVYGRNTAAESVTLSASASGLVTGTAILQVDPLFLEWSGPSTVEVGTCSAAFTVTLKDGSGTARSVNTSFSVTLSASGIGVFYSDSLCATAVTSRSWTSGKTSDTLYFKDSRAETQTLAATATGLNAASRTVTTTPSPPASLRISGPSVVKTGRCYETFSVTSLDSGGNPSPLGTTTTITLNGTGGGSFYSDAGCSSAVSSVTMTAGSSMQQLYFRSPQAEDLTLSPSAPGFTSQTLRLSVEPLPAREVILGEDFTCTLTPSDGSVRCWGSNSAGQLGVGNLVTRSAPLSTPINFGGGRRATMVQAGRAHVCALLEDGAVMCWGFNPYGQVGDGSGSNKSLPVTVNFGAGVTAKFIAAGTDHSCAILTSGEIRCWGSAGSGRLGYGSTANQLSPAPVDLGLGRTAKALALGVNHSCAILNDDSLICWGSSGNGRLGNGVSSGLEVLSPPTAPVKVGAGRWVKSVALGAGHTCAILDDDSLTCWGLGSSGQLGRGNTSSLSTPPSAINFGTGKTVKEVTAGNTHTCARLNDDGVRCWGSSFEGALGLGTDLNTRTSPPATGLTFASGRVARSVVASQYGDHTCAVLDLGDVVCWGSNARGGLGQGDISWRLTPPASALDLGTGTTTPKVAAGLLHTCLLRRDGTVACFGSPLWGRLGYGDFIQRSLVPAQGVNLGGSAQDLTAGSHHTCALLTTGTVKCWGLNGYGQLGDGTFTNRTTPVTVNLGTGRTAKRISAGSNFTCAIMDDDTLSCWGVNSYKQLGVGSTAGSVSTPTAAVLDPGVTVKKVSTGEFHTCAIFANDTATCWGDNKYSQLATGDTTDYTTPMAGLIIPGGAVRDIVAVNSISCVLFEDGSLRCYGYPGLGMASSSGVSVDVGSGRYATSLFSNSADEGQQVCAILDDNSAKCWGYNGSGQLGNGTLTDRGSPPSTPLDLGAGRYPLSMAPGGNFTCAVLDNLTAKCWGYCGIGQCGDATTGIFLTPPSTPIVFPE